MSSFWDNVDRSGGPTACWPWVGTRFQTGYGAYRPGPGQNQRGAHRVAYELTTGEIGPGLLVCHTCDEPPCCNPAHLFTGTPAENSADMVAKGRQARGERGGRAKLTEGAVRSIRQLLGEGQPPGSIARRFGVSRWTVREIAAGRRWAHLA